MADIPCPSCGARHDFLALNEISDAIEFRDLIAELDPSLRGALKHYLSLYRQQRNGAITWCRMIALCEPLMSELRDGYCRRNGMDHPAGPEQWAAAMWIVYEARATLTLPLNGHGYLREVCMGLARKAGAVSERAKESGLRTGASRRTEPVAAGGQTDAARQSMIRSDILTQLALGVSPAEIVPRWPGLTVEEIERLRGAQ